MGVVSTAAPNPNTLTNTTTNAGRTERQLRWGVSSVLLDSNGHITKPETNLLSDSTAVTAVSQLQSTAIMYSTPAVVYEHEPPTRTDGREIL